MAVLIPYAALNFFHWQNSRILGVIQVATMVFLLIPAAWICRTQRKRNIASNLLMLGVFINMMALLVHGDPAGMNLLLINAFPFLIFLINKQSRAWVYGLTFIVINFIYLFLLLDQLEYVFRYDHDVRFQFLLSLIFYTFIAATSSKLRINFETRLNDKVKEKTLVASQLLEDLQFMATHDGLTKLPNRVQLLKHLAEEIAYVRGQGNCVVACNVRVERLLQMGNILGDAGAQRVLIAVSKKLSEMCSENSFLAHTRQDEFVIVQRVQDDCQAEPNFHFLIDANNFLVHEQGHDFFVELTFGIASFPSHAQNETQLLNRAEQTMLHARANRLQCAVYDSELEKIFIRHHLLFGKLLEALRLQQLEVHYQPQIDMSTNAVVGVEALMRWNDPIDGLIPPDVFIPIAEESGLIDLLSKWLIFHCMRQHAEWREMGFDLNISINISSRNLMAPDLLAVLKTAMQETNFLPNRLTIEITESCAMSSPERTLGILQEIHAAGIALSIDDFGTGYSSLAYLKDLPIKELKIDKSFIKNLCTDSDDQVIVGSTIDLAHSFGLSVVAEGIEDEKTIQWLRSRGCDFGQGFHIERPLPADKFIRFMSQKTASPLPLANVNPVGM